MENTITSSGTITMLRVQTLGSKYGPSTDELDVEVIITLDTEERRAFGFQLRNDKRLPSQEGMLTLLRDAFRHAWTVHIEYSIDENVNNFVLFRVWLKK